MSLADLTSKSADPDDHHPIIRHLIRHDTQYGGYDEWSVACICGGLYKTTTDKYFIPSEASAQRLYKNHLRQAGVLSADQIASEDDEVDEQPDYEGIEQAMLPILESMVASLASLLEGDIDTTYTVMKRLLFLLERRARRELNR